MIPFNLSAIASDPKISEDVQLLERWFAQFAAKNSGGNVTIIPQTPSRFLSGLSFYDISHLTQPDPFVRFMSNEIARYANTQRLTRNCIGMKIGVISTGYSDGACRPR